MPRLLVDIPEDDVARLDALAAKDKRSRAATIRAAVKLYIGENTDNAWIERYAGLWKGRNDIGDPIEYQRLMRKDRTPYEDT